jgi:hypothetical protein
LADRPEANFGRLIGGRFGRLIGGRFGRLINVGCIAKNSPTSALS